MEYKNITVLSLNLCKTRGRVPSPRFPRQFEWKPDEREGNRDKEERGVSIIIRLKASAGIIRDTGSLISPRNARTRQIKWMAMCVLPCERETRCITRSKSCLLLPGDVRCIFAKRPGVAQEKSFLSERFTSIFCDSFAPYPRRRTNFKMDVGILSGRD